MMLDIKNVGEQNTHIHAKHSNMQRHLAYSLSNNLMMTPC
jgi:hypothetical protein